MNKTLLLTAAALALVSFNANAASSGSANGTAQVEVVKDMEIEHTGTALNFGSVYAKADNTVTVTAAASPARTGEAFGTFTADNFTIRGPQGSPYTITVPASATMTKGNDELVATLNPSASGAQTMGASDLIIYVGGSVTTTADTPTGAYTGSYTVSISY